MAYNKYKEIYMIEIIKELRATSSTLDKLRILREHKDNHEWRLYLREVYNLFAVYGVSGDKIGGRDDLENLKLCRSIDAGVSTTLINKAYPGLIPTKAKIMKAKDKAVDQISYPVYTEIKYDGNYTLITRMDDVNRYFTSGGHEYTIGDAEEPNLLIDGVYVAERIYGDGKLGDRRRANLRGTKRGGKLQHAQEGNRFMIFDYLTWDDFNNDISEEPFKLRRARLITAAPDHHVESRILDNREQLDVYMSGVTAEGYEGLMLKNPHHKWRNTKSRTLDVVKYKIRNTADLLCVDELPGETAKTQDVIGSLLLRDSEGVEVKVSSGLSDSERTSWGCFKDKVVEVGYEQKMDTYIQPTFIRVREDKTVEEID